jgi:hypothetical protein
MWFNETYKNIKEINQLKVGKINDWKKICFNKTI